MKINEAISKACELRPNILTSDVFLTWLSSLDGRVHTEIFESQEAFIPYTQGDENKELSLPTPYDDIYVYYLMAMIDFANSDYDKYANDMSMFNSKFEEYSKYYIRTNTKKETTHFKNIW